MGFFYDKNTPLETYIFQSGGVFPYLCFSTLFMKILMLCEFYSPELAYQENFLMKYFTKKGHEVILITSLYEDVNDYINNVAITSNDIECFEDYGAKGYRIPLKYNFLGKIKKFKNIRPILDEFKPDMVFLNDFMPNIDEIAAYKLEHPEMKILMDYHSDYTNSGKNWLSINILHKIIRKQLYSDPYRHMISRYFPVTPGSADFLHQLYDIPRSEMTLLPLGADIDRIEKVREKGDYKKIRKDLNIPEDHIVIFTGGKLEPKKNTHLLTKAFRMLKRKDVHLLVVGKASAENRDYEEEIFYPVKEMQNVHRMGWADTERLYSCMLASDFAVFPSSQSILWLEAIGCGLPVINGDVGGQSLSYINKYNVVQELSKNEINAENFALKIQELISNPDELAKRKRASIDTIKEFLDWNHLIDKVILS